MRRFVVMEETLDHSLVKVLYFSTVARQPRLYPPVAKMNSLYVAAPRLDRGVMSGTTEDH